MLQRDAFIEEVKKRLETDKDIYFLSAAAPKSADRK